MLSLRPAKARNIKNLQNWLTEARCLTRNEMEYLEMDDLFELISTDDDAVAMLGHGVEEMLNRLPSGLRKVRIHDYYHR